mmetsp:Transcript_52007/g.134140  ORF Transcript_52007/g.134140 Transcript_52007/m.134140 type:complete len:296 (-) Transcript_52007:33-920(-)
MADPPRVQVEHGAEDLLHDDARLQLRALPDPLETPLQVAALAELHHQVEVLLVLEDLIQHDQVGVVDHLHDRNLVLQHHHFLLHLLLGDGLRRAGRARGPDEGPRDLAEGPLAEDLLLHLVVGPQVTMVVDHDVQGLRGHHAHSMHDRQAHLAPLLARARRHAAVAGRGVGEGLRLRGRVVGPDRRLPRGRVRGLAAVAAEDGRVLRVLGALVVLVPPDSLGVRQQRRRRGRRQAALAQVGDLRDDLHVLLAGDSRVPAVAAGHPRAGPAAGLEGAVAPGARAGQPRFAIVRYGL